MCSLEATTILFETIMIGTTNSQMMGAVVCAAALTMMMMMVISSRSATMVQSGIHDHGTSTDFCSNMFMVMAMSGFQWSLFGKTPGDCLSYLTPAWKLESRGKFQGAMVYTFLLAMLAEGSHALQVVLRPHIPKRMEHVTNVIFLGMQRFMAYILMLVVMMYSWELLISVICGVMAGRLLFPNVTRREWRRDARLLQSTTSSPPPLSEVEGEDEPLLSGDASVRRRR